MLDGTDSNFMKARWSAADETVTARGRAEHPAQEDRRRTSLYLELMQKFGTGSHLQLGLCYRYLPTDIYPGVQLDSVRLQEFEISLDRLPPWTSWGENFYLPSCPAIDLFLFCPLCSQKALRGENNSWGNKYDPGQCQFPLKASFTMNHTLSGLLFIPT